MHQEHNERNYHVFYQLCKGVRPLSGTVPSFPCCLMKKSFVVAAVVVVVCFETEVDRCPVLSQVSCVLFEYRRALQDVLRGTPIVLQLSLRRVSPGDASQPRSFADVLYSVQYSGWICIRRRGCSRGVLSFGLLKYVFFCQVPLAAAKPPFGRKMDGGFDIPMLLYQYISAVWSLCLRPPVLRLSCRYHSTLGESMDPTSHSSCGNKWYYR